MWNRSTGILDGPPSGSEVNIVHNEARAAEIDCGGGNYASRRSRTRDTVKLTVCVSVCVCVCVFQL